MTECLQLHNGEGVSTVSVVVLSIVAYKVVVEMSVVVRNNVVEMGRSNDVVLVTVTMAANVSRGIFVSFPSCSMSSRRNAGAKMGGYHFAIAGRAMTVATLKPRQNSFRRNCRAILEAGDAVWGCGFCGPGSGLVK